MAPLHASKISGIKTRCVGDARDATEIGGNNERSGEFVIDEPKKRGRPPKPPMQGKGSNFATRITAETRAALEAEAERTGRSKSQVAEIWLELGQAVSALGPHATPALTGLIGQILQYAALVTRVKGDPTKSVWARDVFSAGVQEILADTLGHVADELADEMGTLRHAAHEMLAAFPEDAGSSLEVLRKRVSALANGAISRSDPDWPALGQDLEEFSNTHGRQGFLGNLPGTEEARILGARAHILVGHMISTELTEQKIRRETADAAVEARTLLGKKGQESGA
jgi:hypothetical protein